MRGGRTFTPELAARLADQFRAISAANAHPDADASVSQLRAHYRKLLSRSTDLTRNDADKYGDGDQSPAKAAGYNSAGQDLLDAWSSGLDFNPHSDSLELRALLAPFNVLCYFGDADAVQRELDAVSGEERRRLIETRVTLLRHTPLLCCISGARMVGKAPFPRNADHVRVVRALLAAGARHDCRDVAGFTPVHHCVTSVTNEYTVSRILPLLLDAGADVNAKNRLGCTPLMSPVLNYQNDCVSRLVAAGADPHVVDNCGSSPLGAARMLSNAHATTLFSKATKRAAAKTAPTRLDGDSGGFLGRRVQISGLQSRPELNGTHGIATDFDAAASRYTVKPESGGASFRVKTSNLALAVAEMHVCFACHAPGAKKLCSRCMSVSFCNAECATKGWPSHKAGCKATTNATLAIVPPGTGASRDAVQLLTFADMIPDKRSPAGAPPAVGKRFIVKVQVPLPVPPLPETQELGSVSALCAYNADRSVQFWVFPDNPKYAALKQTVHTHGLAGGGGGASDVVIMHLPAEEAKQGLNAYFHARLEENGHLHIQFGEVLPRQTW